MTIEQDIEALNKAADDLRPLPDDEPLKAPLAGIIDEINRLRAVQSRVANGEQARAEPAVPEFDPEAPVAKRAVIKLPKVIADSSNAVARLEGADA